MALYFVSGICAGLVFLLCLFGVKSTLVRDVKDLVSDIEDEIKTARRSRPGLIIDDDISLDSSFPRLTQPYRGADMFSPEMVMTVVMDEKRDEERDKAEVSNGDIWPNCNFSPYAIHPLQKWMHISYGLAYCAKDLTKTQWDVVHVCWLPVTL